MSEDERLSGLVGEYLALYLCSSTGQEIPCPANSTSETGYTPGCVSGECILAKKKLLFDRLLEQ